MTALAIKPLATLAASWNVAFQPRGGAAASIVRPALASLSEHADAGAKLNCVPASALPDKQQFRNHRSRGQR